MGWRMGLARQFYDNLALVICVGRQVGAVACMQSSKSVLALVLPAIVLLTFIPLGPRMEFQAYRTGLIIAGSGLPRLPALLGRTVVTAKPLLVLLTIFSASVQS